MLVTYNLKVYTNKLNETSVEVSFYLYYRKDSKAQKQEGMDRMCCQPMMQQEGRWHMNNFIFENTTRTYFGKGCVKEYLTCLAGQYGNNVLFAYGEGSIKKNGIYEEVIKSLEKAGKNIIEFPGIASKPTYSKVLEGAELARKNRVELIVAVGGGSVMDCCKAVSMAAVYEGDLWDDFIARPGIMEFEPIPLGVVVTTSGTGSAMNGSSVITNKALKIRSGRDYPKCSPRFALMDPVYTYSETERQMVSGGLATLSHMMENYFTKPDENNVSDDISEALMRSAILNLKTAVENPQDYTAKSNLMWEAAMAGNRIMKLGKQADIQCRQMEYQLSAYTNCSDGEGIAVLQPVYLRHIYRDDCVKFKRFAVNVWGISDIGKTDEETACAGVEALAGFVRKVGLPATLQELGVDQSIELKKIADSCVIPAGSARRLTQEEILGIFRECM